MQFNYRAMELTDRYEISSSAIYRDEDDGAFLFDPESGNLKYLNLSAKELFLMIDQNNDITQLIQHLQDIYPDADKDQIQKDVEEFIQQLEENGFITAVAAQ